MADALAAHLAEYQALKSEQTDRIGRRDSLVYANLAATAAAGYAALQGNLPALLLAVPVVGILLGWTYLANDLMVTAIGGYIRREMAPRVAEVAGDPAPFGWESEHAGDTRRGQRKVIQLGVDVVTFVGPGLVALDVLAATSPLHWWIVAAAVADFAGLAVLTWQIASYSRPTREGATP